MTCPKCKVKSYCPCVLCSVSNKNKLLWVWLEDGETIKCPACGFEANSSIWEEFEYQQTIKIINGEK